MITNLEQYPIIREVPYTPQNLLDFEQQVVNSWESAKIRGPVHISNGNEQELIEIFQRIHPTDWVFSTWRSHYHALLKGVDLDWLMNKILSGHSMTICNMKEKFYASAIVGGCLPIALGVAQALKRNNSTEKVWCFIGDMSFESGLFYEVHKYVRNFQLPLHFVVEDNNLSTYTPTEHTWGVKRPIPDDVIHYTYTSKYPHYGTGKWVAF